MNIKTIFDMGLYLTAFVFIMAGFSHSSAQDTGTPATFVVKNGAFPWVDRANVWQLAEVPASIDGNGPLPQQNCGSRMIVVPDGTKYILLGVAAKDLDKFKIDYPDAQPTGEVTSVVHTDGTGVLTYTIFKLSNPAASVGDKTFLAGLILLQINDKPTAAK